MPGYKLYKFSRVNLNKYILILPLLMLVLLYNVSIAQHPKKKHSASLSISLLGTKPAITDNRFSTIIFSGVIPGFNLSFQYNRPKITHQLSISGTTGKLYSDVSTKHQIHNQSFVINYVNYLAVTDRIKKFQFKAGSSVLFLNTQRTFKNFINNNYSFETLLCLAPVAIASYYILPNSQKIEMQCQLQLPVLNHLIQPEFGNSEPGKKQPYSNYTGSFNTIFFIKSVFNLNIKLEKKHTVALSYNWEFYDIKTIRSVRSASHQLGLTYTYNL